MTIQDNAKVTRFCPECGRKFNADSKQFDEPRICPACKTRVIFLDYSKPEVSAVDVAEPPLPLYSQRIRASVIWIAVVALVVLLLATAVAVITANFSAFFVLSCICLVAGIAGACVFLESTSTLSRLNSSLRIKNEQLQAAAAEQTKYLTLYYGFKKNFDSLVLEEHQKLEKQWEGRLSDAARTLGEAEKLKIQTESNVAANQAATVKMAERMLTEVRKSIASKLNANNFATSKERFLDAVAFCAKQGHQVSDQVVADFLSNLQRDYEQAVRTQLAKEEQARIREKMRDEAKAEKELARELARIEAEERAIRAAIEVALQRSAGEHSAELDSLRQRLAEAESRAERAKSMAQMTKAGNVYVISNIGSMGEDVFKIGMTRRLEPLDRVKELSDASVPFPFDVHMMISSLNAPALEATLHRVFHKRRVNRVNFRKEFFRVSIDEIVSVVEQECGVVDYIVAPEALEYRETLTLSDADFEFISSQVNPEELSEED